METGKMNEDFKEYNKSKEGKYHALQLLEFLFKEYRTAERYLHIGLAFLFALLAYLWKEIDITKIETETVIIYIPFLILWGVNLGIGFIYTWYLGVGISIMDYERKLTWLHVRPMFQFNIGLCNGNIGERSLIFLSPILMPALSGLISGLFYLTKFVIPAEFVGSKNSVNLEPLLSIIFVLLLCFSSLMITYRITLNFRKAIIKNLPPRNFEIGAESKDNKP
jgi:hypothetical protein